MSTKKSNKLHDTRKDSTKEREKRKEEETFQFFGTNRILGMNLCKKLIQFGVTAQ